MLHGHRSLSIALLVTISAQPAWAQDPGPGDRGLTEPGLALPATSTDSSPIATGPVTVLVMRSGEGLRIARAADGEGRSVSVVALEPAGHGKVLASRRFRAAESSGFGYRIHPILRQMQFHAGIDIARPAGTRIIAASDGTVVQAGWAAGYGLLVTVDHGGGVQTRYAHLSGLGVSPGQRIRRGDVLGSVGSTGRSTGPHLHYEVRVNGRPVSPVSARKGQ